MEVDLNSSIALGLAVLLLATSVCGVVRAQAGESSEDEARALFEKGQAAFESNDYETALDAWTAAYERSGRPELLFNIAQVARLLGRYLEEKQALERFVVARSTPASARRAARARLAELRQNVDEPEARALFERGQFAYHDGDYEAALELWTRAYELSGRPAILYNIAQAHGRLGQFVEEKEALEHFLEESNGHEAYRVGAERRIEAIEARIARTAVVIEGALAGAEVYVDGTYVGTLPFDGPVHVAPGRHRVTARHEGYVDANASVSVNAGEVARVELDFEEIVVVVENEPKASTMAWALWGSGGGLVVGGAVLGGLAFGKGRGAERGSPDAVQSRKMGIGADVMIGVGVATAATGLVVHFLQKKSGRAEDAPTAPLVSVSPTRDGAVLSITGGF